MTALAACVIFLASLCICQLRAESKWIQCGKEEEGVIDLVAAPGKKVVWLHTDHLCSNTTDVVPVTDCGIKLKVPPGMKFGIWIDRMFYMPGGPRHPFAKGMYFYIVIQYTVYLLTSNMRDPGDPKLFPRDQNNKNQMLFHEDFGIIWVKLKFYAKNHINLTVLAIT